MGELIYKDESYAILGACFNVYKTMGCGFLENVYQECLEIEFEYQKLPFMSQKEFTLEYRNHVLKQTYKPDFICFDKIIIELKAVSKLLKEHEAQLLNYLKATDIEVGLLLNFGPKPQMIRKAFDNHRK